MRYYGHIPFRHAMAAIGIALTLSAIVHLGAVAHFLEYEAVQISELRSKQSTAKLAAFRYLLTKSEASEPPPTKSVADNANP